MASLLNLRNAQTPLLPPSYSTDDFIRNPGGGCYREQISTCRFLSIKVDIAASVGKAGIVANVCSYSPFPRSDHTPSALGKPPSLHRSAIKASSSYRSVRRWAAQLRPPHGAGKQRESLCLHQPATGHGQAVYGAHLRDGGLLALYAAELQHALAVVENVNCISPSPPSGLCRRITSDYSTARS